MMENNAPSAELWFYSGTMNILKLQSDLMSLVPEFSGLAIRKTVVEIWFDNGFAVTQNVRDSISTVISQHDPYDLDQAASIAVGMLEDYYKDVVVSQAMQYNNEALSVTKDAQQDWSALFLQKDAITYPVIVPTTTGTYLSLPDQASVVMLYNALYDHCYALRLSLASAVADVSTALTQQDMDNTVAQYTGVG